MNNIKIYLIFTATMLTSFSSITLAKTYNAEELSVFAKQYLEDNLSPPSSGRLNITVSQLDPRVKINPCEVPLQANIPEKNYSRNVNIKIYCNGVNPWNIYIPARVSTVIPVVVAKIQIRKGTVLNQGNLIITHKDINSVHGDVIDDIAQVSGAKAKRNISKDKPISLKYMCYVCKGDSVTIIAQSDNLHIKTYGIALESGSIGDTIRVKNVKSSKTVFTEVRGINQVIINL